MHLCMLHISSLTSRGAGKAGDSVAAAGIRAEHSEPNMVGVGVQRDRLCCSPCHNDTLRCHRQRGDLLLRRGPGLCDQVGRIMCAKAEVKAGQSLAHSCNNQGVPAGGRVQVRPSHGACSAEKENLTLHVSPGSPYLLEGLVEQMLQQASACKTQCWILVGLQGAVLM